MPINLETFKPEYEKWVEESLPDYRAGKLAEIVKKYPLIVSEGVPWMPCRPLPNRARSASFPTSGNVRINHK